MEKKKYIVYRNDDVNEPVDVFSADTIAECEEWINEQVEGLTPVNEEFPCTDDVMRSSKTFYYEVYEGEMITEIDGVAVYSDLCYSSCYYYKD